MMRPDQHPDEPLRTIDTFGCTRTGKERRTNSDQFVVAELRRAARVRHASDADLDDSRRFGDHQAHVLLVADGVDGRAGAKLASSVVVDQVMESVLNSVPWTPALDVQTEAELRRELKKTVVRCNREVTQAAQQSSGDAGMATTLTLAFVRWPLAFVVHAGDSRAYLVRGGEIERLTTDHTFAQQMVEDGELPPAEAETSGFANLLWNAVGGDSKVTPELTVKKLEYGDALLLCTDGLTSHLSDGAIRHLVQPRRSAKETCEQLVDTVASIGGHDDVTVALARFAEETRSAAATREVPEPVLHAAAQRAAPAGTAKAARSRQSRVG